jgi:hypothetical protein
MGGERYRVPEAAARLKSPRGDVVMWAPTQSVLVSVVRGHGDEPLAELIIKEQERLLSGRRDAVSFFDALDFHGYDPVFRTSMAAFARRARSAGQLRSIQALTRSKLVAMGIAVVNLAIGQLIHVMAEPKAFEDALVREGAGAALSRARATG